MYILNIFSQCTSPIINNDVIIIRSDNRLTQLNRSVIPKSVCCGSPLRRGAVIRVPRNIELNISACNRKLAKIFHNVIINMLLIVNH